MWERARRYSAVTIDAVGGAGGSAELVRGEWPFLTFEWYHRAGPAAPAFPALPPPVSREIYRPGLHEAEKAPPGPPWCP